MDIDYQQPEFPNLYQYRPDEQTSLIPKLKDNKDLIMDLIDSDKFLEQLEAELLGFVWDQKEQSYKQKYCPSVTEDCINWLIPYLRSHFNKSMPLTNYTKDEINGFMKEIIITITNVFCAEYYLFFPKDTKYKKITHLRGTLDKVEHTINAVYNRALGSGVTKMLSETVQKNISEVQSSNQNDERKSFVSGMNMLKR